jgi:hypothetical protein
MFLSRLLVSDRYICIFRVTDEDSERGLINSAGSEKCQSGLIFERINGRTTVPSWVPGLWMVKTHMSLAGSLLDHYLENPKEHLALQYIWLQMSTPKFSRLSSQQVPGIFSPELLRGLALVVTESTQQWVLLESYCGSRTKPAKFLQMNFWQKLKKNNY